MKKFFLLILFITGSTLFAFANHITGGEMYYEFIGMSGADYRYHITLKLYRDCNAPQDAAQLDPTAYIAIFDNKDNSLVAGQNVNKKPTVRLNLSTPNPCITNPPAVCYEVGYYDYEVILPPSEAGYTIVYQRCCRIRGINNLAGNSNDIGATYTAVIPGTLPLAIAPENNSARFLGADTVVICEGNPFTYNFGAFDDDSDSLVYTFCSAFRGGSTGNATPVPPSSPPYASVPYRSPFGASGPLGSAVTINSTNGIITGVAPAQGIYVVTVCVTEYRNGIPIATQRKDLQMKVADCTLAAASLKPEYISCDGFTLTYFNLSNSPLITSYFWDFGVPGVTNDTANIARPTYTYTDTGVYQMKLVTNRGQICSDSTTAMVKVFPGFFPAFSSTGICITKPTQFTDNTTTAYGVVDTWKWDFGETTVNDDTSIIRNPSYIYPALGIKIARLIVTNSKGCVDTAFKEISIIDKPPITVLPKDTLICVPDGVQLQAVSTGVYSWSPAVNIVNANTATPTVSPTTTTWYYVDVDEQGCKNRDSVLVRVVDHVTLNALGDTTICLGDEAQLNAATDGLRFEWSPIALVSDPAIINPVTTPAGTTTYSITARIGSCSATDEVTVRTVPYPVARAGADTMICYNTPAQLHAQFVGNTFAWSPSFSLNNAQIANPIATPFRTTAYVLTVYDNIGCPKPGRDTILVTVLPKVNAFAGRDTSVVVDQPLQFNATGGVVYSWSPATGLSATDIANPVGLYSSEIDSIRYKVLVVDEAGCSDSATVKVKVFRVNPQVFVPTAFTPNGDGLNDVVRPIAVGIQQINYFRIFNRWGQLVFSTTTNEQGWDGSISGKPQATNTYVWLVEAVDYLGRKFFKKGTVTLIR